MPILMPQPIPDRYRGTCEFCGQARDVRDLGV
jgi:hypothetical protein